MSELPPVGSKHPAKIRGAALDTDSYGDPCIACLLAVQFNGEWFRVEGRLFLSVEKPYDKGRTAYDRSVQALKAAGYNGDPLDIPNAPLPGEVEVEIEHRHYQTENGGTGIALKAKYINAPRREVKVFSPPSDKAVEAFRRKVAAHLHGSNASESYKPASMTNDS